MPLLSSSRSLARTPSTPACSTRLRVWPSTPAVRDPRLRFTRSHATSNVAGSQTRLNRSPKRCCSSSPAHRCSLVCHPSTRSSATLASSGAERIHARPPERLLMLRSCCPPSPCGRLSRPRTTTRTPPRPAPIGRHRALPGCHQQPGARGALPTFTMIRLTGSAAGCTPTAHPTGTRSIPSATTPGQNRRARSEPPLNRAASLLSTTHVHQVSGRLRNRGASTTTSLSLYLSVSLARTRASGSAARPSHCRDA